MDPPAVSKTIFYFIQLKKFNILFCRNPLNQRLVSRPREAVLCRYILVIESASLLVETEPTKFARLRMIKVADRVHTVGMKFTNDDRPSDHRSSNADDGSHCDGCRVKKIATGLGAERIKLAKRMQKETVVGAKGAVGKGGAGVTGVMKLALETDAVWEELASLLVLEHHHWLGS